MARTISGFAHKITEEIYFDSGSRRLHLHPAVKNGCVVDAGSHYSFELWRKPAEFGGVPDADFLHTLVCCVELAQCGSGGVLDWLRAGKVRGTWRLGSKRCSCLCPTASAAIAPASCGTSQRPRIRFRCGLALLDLR